MTTTFTDSEIEMLKTAVNQMAKLWALSAQEHGTELLAREQLASWSALLEKLEAV